MKSYSCLFLIILSAIVLSAQSDKTFVVKKDPVAGAANWSFLNRSYLHVNCKYQFNLSPVTGFVDSVAAINLSVQREKKLIYVTTPAMDTSAALIFYKYDKYGTAVPVHLQHFFVTKDPKRSGMPPP